MMLEAVQEEAGAALIQSSFASQLGNPAPLP